MTYDEWIEQFIEKVGDTTSLCGPATLEMQEAFPELMRVRGHVVCSARERWPHWWLVTATGTIVDPTARQFPPILYYEPHDEEGPEPTGICPNCSGYCYDGGTVCSEACAIAYAAYVMHG